MAGLQIRIRSILPPYPLSQNGVQKPEVRKLDDRTRNSTGNLAYSSTTRHDRIKIQTVKKRLSRLGISERSIPIPPNDAGNQNPKGCPGLQAGGVNMLACRYARNKIPTVNLLCSGQSLKRQCRQHDAKS